MDNRMTYSLFGVLRPPTLALLILVMMVSPKMASADDPGSSQDDGQWLMAPKDYANTRFSRLDQVNTGNVTNLKVAWTFSTGVNRGQESAPLVVSNIMYVVTPYPNFVYALDLANQGALIWKYEPKPSAAAQGVACCDVVNRGAVYWEGKIIFNTLDTHTIALDAQNGAGAVTTKKTRSRSTIIGPKPPSNAWPICGWPIIPWPAVRPVQPKPSWRSVRAMGRPPGRPRSPSCWLPPSTSPWPAAQTAVNPIQAFFSPTILR